MSKRPAAKRRTSIKPAPGAADNARGARPGGFALSELRQLIQLVQSTGIGELEVTAGNRTVRIAAQSGVMPGVTVAAPATPAPSTPAAPVKSAVSDTESLAAITSPMVGTFYRAPAPDADPYIEVGDVVTVGQTVCIIEAMKLMNEIESEIKGRVVRILAENAQPVEFGQKLFLVEPV